MKKEFNLITVLGLGYIGLPTAAMFASNGIKVLGVDVKKSVIEKLKLGKTHIVEPQLDKYLKEGINSGFFNVSSIPVESDAFIIAVPTPFEDDHSPDLSFVKNACDSISKVLTKGSVVILESTSPVGTTEKVSRWMSQNRPDLKFPHQRVEEPDINIAYCPERVLPGNIIQELVYNDRIIGGLSEKCSKSANSVYKTFVKGKCFLTTARTAEMAKLTENAFRDINIAFANEVSMICDKIDVDIKELISLTNRHPRVQVLNPGCGVGGHCIAVDPWFIINQNKQLAKMMKCAREVNVNKTEWVVKKIIKKITDDQKSLPAGRKIFLTICGISYKPDSDDLRESPSLRIIEKLVNENLGNLIIQIVEPYIDKLPHHSFFTNCRFSRQMTLDQEEHNIVVILVGHKQFRESSIVTNSDLNLLDFS